MPVTKEITKELLEKYYIEDHLHIADIAKLFHCDKAKIYVYRKKFNIPQRPRGYVRRDLVGQTFGKWLVLSRLKRDSRYFWVCRCQCGFEMPIIGSNLINKSSTQCRRCAYNDMRCKDIVPPWFMCHIKIGAKKRNLAYEITLEMVTQLFIDQNNKCKLSGLEIKFAPCLMDHRYKRATTASLDRIDSTKGYTADNIQWVHKDIQLLKMNLPEGRFKELCCAVAAQQQLTLAA